MNLEELYLISTLNPFIPISIQRNRRSNILSLIYFISINGQIIIISPICDFFSIVIIPH